MLFSLSCHRPQNNGKFCPGSSRLNQLCNTRPCPLPSVDFRAQQCAEYNSKPFRGWYYKWKPYTKVDSKIRQSWPKVFMDVLCLCMHIHMSSENKKNCLRQNQLMCIISVFLVLPPNYVLLPNTIFCLF